MSVRVQKVGFMLIVIYVRILLKLAVPFSRFIFLRGPPMWIDNGLKDFKLTPVATMAGLLLHAMAGKPAGGICISHFAAASLLPPSTQRIPSWPSLVALLSSLSCGSSWSSLESVYQKRRVMLSCPCGYIVEAFAKYCWRL